MSVTLAVQKAIRARLVSAAAVTGLVPAANIIDRNASPAPDPSIILGEDQTVDEGAIARNRTRVYSTLHVWKVEPGLVGVKAIADAIRSAIAADRLRLDHPLHAADCYVSGARFLRDPDGETAHAVVTIETVVGGG